MWGSEWRGKGRVRLAPALIGQWGAPTWELWLQQATIASSCAFRVSDAADLIVSNTPRTACCASRTLPESSFRNALLSASIIHLLLRYGSLGQMEREHSYSLS